MVLEERIIHAVLLPGETLEDFTQRAGVVAELVALIDNGPPAYQVVLTTMATGTIEFWGSCVYDHPHLASTEYARLTGEWIPTQDYEAVVRGGR